MILFAPYTTSSSAEAQFRKITHRQSTTTSPFGDDRFSDPVVRADPLDDTTNQQPGNVRGYAGEGLRSGYTLEEGDNDRWVKFAKPSVYLRTQKWTE